MSAGRIGFWSPGSYQPLIEVISNASWWISLELERILYIIGAIFLTTLLGTNNLRLLTYPLRQAAEVVWFRFMINECWLFLIEIAQPHDGNLLYSMYIGGLHFTLWHRITNAYVPPTIVIYISIHIDSLFRVRSPYNVCSHYLVMLWHLCVPNIYKSQL